MSDDLDPPGRSRASSGKRWLDRDPERSEDPEGAEILALMLAENQRELSEFEARRIESYVNRTPELRAYLEGSSSAARARTDAIHALLGSELDSDLAAATAEEWRRVDIAVHGGLVDPIEGAPRRDERSSPAPLPAARDAATVVPLPEGARPPSSYSAWQTVAAVAACLLLGFFVVQKASESDPKSSPEISQGRDPSAPYEPGPNEVIITELPDDVIDVQIDDVDGALMIYVTSG
ncbi:MAG: hypothetical protein KDC38_11830 [Planctomycetes bacterium]|nr:hypothetical protein [Planctomycetota bacterium]